MDAPLDDLTASVRQSIEAAQANGALEALIQFVRLINSDPSSAGRIYESRDLDALCFEIGRQLGATEDEEPAAGPGVTAETQIYVATELYEAGGHTRVIGDFMAAQPGRDHRILLTNIHGRKIPESMGARITAAEASLESAPAGDAAAKARWLAGRLRHFREARIFLFTHHEDAVAVAACAASRPPRLHFYHHADHHLALGLHLPGVDHLDLTPFSFFHCRDGIGLDRVRYLPLTTPETSAREPADFRAGPQDPEFVTCACGGEGKFSAPYAWPYFGMIAELLRQTAGAHVHIGPLSEQALEAVATELRRAGVDPGRFRHVPHVESLGAALRESGVSLFLGSWPIGGARAQLEALSTGTPVLGHINCEHEYLGVQCLLPSSARAWRSPQDFFAAVTSLTPTALQQQSRKARAWWEKFHRGRLLADWLAPAEIMVIDDPPALPRYEPDRLRAWLRERGQGIDLGPHRRALERAEVRCRQLETKLEKERARRVRFEEICGRLRSERANRRRGLLPRLRRWWNDRGTTNPDA